MGFKTRSRVKRIYVPINGKRWHENSRSQILLVSCLLLYPFHRKPFAGNSPYTTTGPATGSFFRMLWQTEGYGQNTVHSLLHTKCFIGSDRTELILFLYKLKILIVYLEVDQ